MKSKVREKERFTTERTERTEQEQNRFTKVHKEKKHEEAQRKNKFLLACGAEKAVTK
jgi:hypothetical protein